MNGFVLFVIHALLILVLFNIHVAVNIVNNIFMNASRSLVVLGQISYKILDQLLRYLRAFQFWNRLRCNEKTLNKTQTWFTTVLFTIGNTY